MKYTWFLLSRSLRNSQHFVTFLHLTRRVRSFFDFDQFIYYSSHKCLFIAFFYNPMVPELLRRDIALYPFRYNDDLRLCSYNHIDYILVFFSSFAAVFRSIFSQYLTHLFPMHLFSTTSKHQKTLRSNLRVNKYNSVTIRNRKG